MRQTYYDRIIKFIYYYLFRNLIIYMDQIRFHLYQNFFQK
jgi:hypothetical protein